MEEDKNTPTPDEFIDFHLRWYLSLRSRVLDLVGDYAGNERFVVEGDSLLRHCFEDPRIDFQGKLHRISPVLRCSSLPACASLTHEGENRWLPAPPCSLRSGTLPGVPCAKALQLPSRLLRWFVSNPRRCFVSAQMTLINIHSQQKPLSPITQLFSKALLPPRSFGHPKASKV
jgi:hypothetical protein